jgi:hypothetical protein
MSTATAHPPSGSTAPDPLHPLAPTSEELR